MNKLHISDEAQQDLFEIREYINDTYDNPESAETTLRRIMKGLRMLQNFGALGAELSSIADVESDYRFLVVKKYIVFYRLENQDVYVDRIIFSRRNYMRILFEDIPSDVDE